MGRVLSVDESDDDVVEVLNSELVDVSEDTVEPEVVDVGPDVDV